MKKVVRLTENDLIRLVKRVINENNEMTTQTKKQSSFESQEWQQLKKIGVNTNSKILKFKDNNGNYQETLNWGKASSNYKGSSKIWFAAGLSNDGGTIEFDISSQDGNMEKIVSNLDKLGLGQYKKDNYGNKTMEMYKIPLKNYQLVIKAINTLSPMINI